MKFIFKKISDNSKSRLKNLHSVHVKLHAGCPHKIHFYTEQYKKYIKHMKKGKLFSLYLILIKLKFMDQVFLVILHWLQKDLLTKTKI